MIDPSTVSINPALPAPLLFDPEPFVFVVG